MKYRWRISPSIIVISISVAKRDVGKQKVRKDYDTFRGWEVKKETAV
jgi:hypothetical protein